MSAPRGAEHVQCVTQIGPAGVPEAYQAECHGARVDFDIRERILTRLGPCLLDVRWRAASPSSSVREWKRLRSVPRARSSTLAGAARFVARSCGSAPRFVACSWQLSNENKPVV